jgi:hypothetical protein
MAGILLLSHIGSGLDDPILFRLHHPEIKYQTQEAQLFNNSTDFSLLPSILPGVVSVSKMRSWVARYSAWPGRSESVAARTGLPETV